MLKMDLEYDEGILLINLSGNLNNKVTYKINNFIVPVLKKHQIKQIVYNMENLKSIDESGVDAILKTKCIVKNYKGKIYFWKVGNNIALKLKRLHIKILDDNNIFNVIRRDEI